MAKSSRASALAKGRPAVRPPAYADGSRIPVVAPCVLPDGRIADVSYCRPVRPDWEDATIDPWRAVVRLRGIPPGTNNNVVIEPSRLLPHGGDT